MKHFYYPSLVVACGIEFDVLDAYPLRQLTETRSEVDCPNCLKQLAVSKLTCPGCDTPGFPHYCDPKPKRTPPRSFGGDITLAQFLTREQYVQEQFREYWLKNDFPDRKFDEHEWWSEFRSWIEGP